MSQAGIISEIQDVNSLIFQANSGTAEPLADVVNVLGSGPYSTTGAGNTITNAVTGDNLFGLAAYGDGSDGMQTFDGAAVVLGIAPAANTYTLARDIFLDTSTINVGVSIITNGFRIFCSGTLTNNGTIQWNGNNASGATAGAKISNANSSINNNNGSSSIPGTAGASGTSASGGNGVAQSSVLCLSGTGGNGGNGTGGRTGGSGGTITSSSLATNKNVRNWPEMMLARQSNLVGGGTGGGAGGGDGANSGGGGGGGGGLVVVAVKTFAGTGTISANGGTGGTPPAGDCGSGGGGGGGLVSVISKSVVSGAISGQTITANGGNPGTPSGGGSSGGIGNPGITIVLPF